MLKFIIIAVVSWLVGVIGWAQIVGSIQNLKVRSSLAFTLALWVVIMGIGAYVGILILNGTTALLVGYGISLVQILMSGKIE